jgi:hypothetical protein
MVKKKRRARVKKIDTSKLSRPSGPVKSSHPHIKLIIPAGKCPAILIGDDRESIRNWIIELTQKKDDNTTYQASVYKYWVREFHESYSQEYKDIGEVIDSLVSSEVNKVSDIGK